MTQVIKRGGKKEKFNPGKIENALKGAAKKAGFSRGRIEKVVNEVGNAVINFYRKKNIVQTSAIRKSIVGRLDRNFKTVASAWRKQEKKKRKK